MTIRLFAMDTTIPPPLDVWMIIVCDGDHGAEPPSSSTFSERGYIAQRHAAKIAGWRFTSEGKHFGPCCGEARA